MAEPQATVRNIVSREIPSIVLAEKGIDITLALQREITVMPVIQKRQFTSDERKEAKYIQQAPEGETFIIEFCIIYQNHLLVTEVLYKSLERVFGDLKTMLT